MYGYEPALKKTPPGQPGDDLQPGLGVDRIGQQQLQDLHRRLKERKLEPVPQLLFFFAPFFHAEKPRSLGSSKLGRFKSSRVPGLLKPSRGDDNKCGLNVGTNKTCSFPRSVPVQPTNGCTTSKTGGTLKKDRPVIRPFSSHQSRVSYQWFKDLGVHTKQTHP